jgi:hypothetical protein
VILPSAPLALGVANGNVTDNENVHHKWLEIKHYFIDRHKHSAVVAEHQSHFPVGMMPKPLKLKRFQRENEITPRYCYPGRNLHA